MPPAGKVSIQFSVDANNFSSGMDKITKQVKSFQGSTSEAGRSTVTSMQSASASLRLLENPMTNNLRALEKWTSQSKLAREAFAAAFPLIGAIAAASVLARLGTDVADFVKKVQEMPKAITTGFGQLNLSTQSATDSLKLTNDELTNSIAKLQGKPQNEIAISIDEARVAADKFAQSLKVDNDAMDQLLSKNHLSSFSLLMGRQGTADREGTVKYYGDQQNDAGLRYQQAVHNGDSAGADKALQDLHNSQQSELNNVLSDRDKRKAIPGLNNDANNAIDTGVATNILEEQNRQQEQLTNAQLAAKQKQAQADKDAADKASALRKKQAEEFRESLEVNQQRYKQYLDALADMQKIAAEHNLDFFKSSGLSSDDNFQLNQSGKSTAAWIQAISQGAEASKANANQMAEASIQMALATGQMTKQDAALASATLHTQEYTDALAKLQEQQRVIASDKRYDNDPTGRRAASNANQNQIDALSADRQMQVAADNQSANPSGSSAGVGFHSAIDDFVASSKDAANQMRELTNSTLKGLNQQIVAAISGQGSSFGNFGAGVARSVAGMGLEKAEGSVLSAFHLGSGGKPGTQNNPMYVRIAGAASAAASSAGGLLKGLLPFLATGGPIDGPAIVGEQGPELFVPSSSGSIVPNHKLSSVSSGAGGIHFAAGAIDARHSTDPAQTEAAIHRAISAAAPHIMAGAVNLGKNMSQRRPSTAR
ncbi:MAG TPA: phage tail tape measure C-terminal domain-containing protein [Edaphobacter sp.]|nr:phage tail tape measure C-terminal domain-containing protein [Edaphobacter sp.]